VTSYKTIIYSTEFAQRTDENTPVGSRSSEERFRSGSLRIARSSHKMQTATTISPTKQHHKMPVITVKHQETRATDTQSDTSASRTTAPASSNATESITSKWSNAVRKVHTPILTGLHKITNLSATHPKSVISGVVAFSLAIFVVGLFTGFSVDVDEDRLWTPGKYCAWTCCGFVHSIAKYLQHSSFL